jgi:hypothetical protein
MANRQTGGKSGKRIKADHQNLEQNQFGLKEAYTVLQRGEYDSIVSNANLYKICTDVLTVCHN